MTPHDAIVKATFGQVDMARGELELVLPAEVRACLDFDTLTVCPGSFVDEDLQHTHSDLLYSVRTTNDIIFNSEFRELEQENPNFNFYVTCTRLAPEDQWAGRRGRINADWVKEHIHDLSNTVFYACGPNELVEATEKLVLEELQVPKVQMKTEKWG